MEEANSFVGQFTQVKIADFIFKVVKKQLLSEDPAKMWYSKQGWLEIRAEMMLLTPEGRQALRHGMCSLDKAKLLSLLGFDEPMG